MLSVATKSLTRCAMQTGVHAVRSADRSRLSRSASEVRPRALAGLARFPQISTMTELLSRPYNKLHEKSTTTKTIGRPLSLSIYAPFRATGSPWHPLCISVSTKKMIRSLKYFPCTPVFLWDMRCILADSPLRLFRHERNRALET